MAKVELECAVYGEGSVFPVQIARDAKVSALQEAIADIVSTEQHVVKPRLVTLYLAKKDGAWLADDHHVKSFLQGGISTQYEEMRPSWKLNKPAYFGDFNLGEEEIHVLVQLPDSASPPSVAVAEPIGPEVDLRSCERLLAFLEGDMTDKEAIVSRPHVLAQESLEFRLVGRKEAIDTASECFKNIIAHANSTATDRVKVAIPVCSGISGLGKTRMLEESGTILEQMKLDPKHVVRVIVPYFNGISPQPVERSMPIEASFSWRLLYRFFLDMNCKLGFDEWFESRLPRNGAQLRLKRAVEVIERKLREKLREPASLYLFLGVDGYQKIDKIGARRKDSTLHSYVSSWRPLELCSA